ncbi:hypothetical protein LTR56_006982 [Elasticomyces elasticus]|nr:hypothetical protein LTR56_006982 [Elasticomyces elasticus]KAK3664149.1 hypothetical protein LTR22_005114 [Elasticomyces elasticus]KAK4927718.1 hypothetical protein LTR49_005588 [Elasticomyces elasticus]KAK5767089.1 hypothetical protein LTS12_002855 [Elasticomyces elasticus]
MPMSILTQAYQLIPPFEHQHTLELYKMSEAFSRFLDLPAELRVRIYEFALVDTIFVGETFVNSATERSRYPSLLATSKQFNNEATPHFYKCSTFRVSFSRGRFEGRWLRRVPSKLRRTMTSIEIFVEIPGEPLSSANITRANEVLKCVETMLRGDGVIFKDGVLKARVVNDSN